jgi:hypothetical protein
MNEWIASKYVIISRETLNVKFLIYVRQTTIFREDIR